MLAWYTLLPGLPSTELEVVAELLVATEPLTGLTDEPEYPGNEPVEVVRVKWLEVLLIVIVGVWASPLKRGGRPLAAEQVGRTSGSESHVRCAMFETVLSLMVKLTDCSGSRLLTVIDPLPLILCEPLAAPDQVIRPFVVLDDEYVILTDTGVEVEQDIDPVGLAVVEQFIVLPTVVPEVVG
ncbi:MAG: hypothetical protein AAF413_01915 [Patescibacteria group bacterium]